MSDKPKSGDTSKNSETVDFAIFREVRIINKDTTVQRLDPGPTQPPNRTPVDDSSSGGSDEK